MATKYVKKRNWTFLVYPESAPFDWIDILQASGLPFAVSPLHDRDVIEATGELKKPHWHCIVCYDGPTTYNCVVDTISPLNGPIPKPIESVKGVYRYFTHQDNPEKAQYSSSDIRLFNGFDISNFDDLTKLEKDKILEFIFEYIKLNDIVEYSDLVDLLQADPDLRTAWSVAITNSILFNYYLRSRRHKYYPKEPTK